VIRSLARLMIGLFLLVIIDTAAAGCPAGGKIVFSCVTAKGKAIALCDAGKTLVYRFGKARRTPEIALRVPRSEASTYQWQGIGRTMSYSVDIPNGDAVYSVFWGVDRLLENHPVSAGVTVLKNNRPLATIPCDGNKPVIQMLEGIDLKPSE
jgi:hypothetical protein